jgi:hypothetical protein
MIAAVRMTISTVQILDMTCNHAVSSLSFQVWEVKNSLQIVFIVVSAMNSARSDRSRDQKHPASPLRSASPDEIQDLQTPNPNIQTKMSNNLTNQARSTYRALLRELPNRRLSTPSPLHQRIRAVFRSEHKPTASDSALPFSPPKTEEERALRIQEAEQLAQYARAQRTYSALLERYNPGMTLDEEEKIRLTARRVGMDLPDLYSEVEKKKE